MRQLPAPAQRRDANVACLVGFLFGGIGLAIYLRTVIDLILPLGIGLLLFAVHPGGASILAGAVIAALYGYFRVKIANEAPSPTPH
jgi:hypothetical protein